jgi:FixJ family two-component response regulator
MDEATLGRIFHPFFTTKAGGLGLGLSISRSIVAAHGGMLSVRSTPAHGTTFCLDLPARASDARTPDAEPAPATASSGTVYVIDDDLSMRRALYRQLYAAGYRVETFASAEDYLERARPHGVACIVSDIRMPGLTGLDLQTFLAQAKRNVPIVFVSGHGDIPTTVHAIKAGAVGFLAKPFTRAELLAVVAEAMARSRAIEAAREEHAELQARYESLTAREREVLALVTAGLLNKVIADRLGTVEGTIKVHRGRVMDKMRAASVADLVRMAERLNLPPVPRAVR